MKITITDDFDLKKIAASGQCFRVREFEDGTYRFITEEQVLYIKKLDSDLYEVDCSEEVWETVWFPYFHLERSYQEVRGRIGIRDKYLRTASESGLGIRILRQDPWEMVVTFIISQQKSIPSIKACVEQLSLRYGTRLVTSMEEIYSFPTALQLAAATEDELRQCRLGYRVPYLMDAVRQVNQGNINLDALYARSDRKVFETLKQIAGIGDKVSNCICLFAYGRTRLAPVDTWIKKVIEKEYKGRNPFPKYKDAAGIMQQYIFYYALTHKKELA